MKDHDCKSVLKYILKARKIEVPDMNWSCPDYCYSHDNSLAIIEKLEKHNLRINYPEKLVIALDHNVYETEPVFLRRLNELKLICQQKNIKIYDQAEGIGHQLILEDGYALPYGYVVGSDSHSTGYGAIGCLSFSITRSDAAYFWHHGNVWLPPLKLVFIKLTGELRNGVRAKDVALTLCGIAKKNDLFNTNIEFYGPGVESLSIDDRITIANMAPEWGAKSTIFPVDKKTINWVKNPQFTATSELYKDSEILINNDDCKYELNLSAIQNQISLPGDPSNLGIVEKIEIQKAYLVSCSETRYGDLERAANILQGKKIHPNVTLYFSASSKTIEEKAKKNGIWQIIVDAGGLALKSACGPCIGKGEGLLGSNESAVSTTSRNYFGRMGAKNSSIYLSNAETVARSAIRGFLTSRLQNLRQGVQKDYFECFNELSKNRSVEKPSPIKTRLSQWDIQGRLVVLPEKNINTDAIFPGKYLYRAEKVNLKDVILENYDPLFKTIVQPGDIILCGDHFGVGSSREQAATAFLDVGVQALIGASFHDVYFRNAINNGLPITICSGILEYVLNIQELKTKTNALDKMLKIHFTKRVAELDGVSFEIEGLNEKMRSIQKKGLLN